jgi:hypothetical protein
MVRQTLKCALIATFVVLVGCSRAVSEADLEATVNARVAGTLSAVVSGEAASVNTPAESGQNQSAEAGASSLAATPTGSGASIGGCPIFPADHIWNTRVADLPVHPNSDAYIASIGADTPLHPDFGGGLWEGDIIGIPYNVVDGSVVEPAQIEFYYPDEADPGPYPIPSDPLIEGGDDRHILIVDTSDCRLIEIYDAAYEGGNRWSAGSGAIWDLTGYMFRPETWTSADAAGLPILPGLVRYDEVAAGEIHHALRFTAEETQQQYVWPARHFASDITDPNVPPMGQRFRLSADFDLSAYPHDVQIILRAMQEYGIILADNGSDWFISGAPDSRWDDEMLVEAFRTIHGSDFEAVDVSSLMIDSDSGQARQP